MKCFWEECSKSGVITSLFSFRYDWKNLVDGYGVKRIKV